MNLLGAKASLMNSTGLDDILQVIYGENTVVHMMSGKAVQIATHVLLLIDKCLNRMIITDIASDSPDLVEKTEEMYSALLACQITLECSYFGQRVKSQS